MGLTFIELLFYDEVAVSPSTQHLTSGNSIMNLLTSLSASSFVFFAPLRFNQYFVLRVQRHTPLLPPCNAQIVQRQP
jgi:hypothetical protein